MSKPIFISFHTPDDFYTWQAGRLIKSLNAFGLESHIVRKNRVGDWSQECFAKAPFILEMLGRFPEQDLVWIDADAEIKRYPELLDDIHTNIAFVENGNGCALASMIFFKNNEVSRSFIKDWILSNRMFPDNRAVDQENFSILAHDYEAAKDVTVTKLPSAYNFEDGISQPIQEPIVIIQWIAARIGRSAEFAKEVCG